MNGTSRLYRSTSERMLGGVAAGLGNYFKIDANIVRLVFLLLALFTGGGFALVYVLLWLILPTPTSTATDVGSVIHENLNEIGSQFRGLSGGNGGNGGTVANGGQGQAAGAAPNGGQLPQGSQPVARTHSRPGTGAMALIIIGAFFLLVNLGMFHWIKWGFWWPVMLIVLGLWLLNRRRA
jgi:phage shock protein PspC (stress-responsive transcriptional regulator)